MERWLPDTQGENMTEKTYKERFEEWFTNQVENGMESFRPTFNHEAIAEKFGAQIHYDEYGLFSYIDFSVTPSGSIMHPEVQEFIYQGLYEFVTSPKVLVRNHTDKWGRMLDENHPDYSPPSRSRSSMRVWSGPCGRSPTLTSLDPSTRSRLSLRAILSLKKARPFRTIRMLGMPTWQPMRHTGRGPGRTLGKTDCVPIFLMSVESHHGTRHETDVGDPGPHPTQLRQAHQDSPAHGVG